MTAENFFRVVVEKLDRQPFQPFTFELLDGRQVEIVRPYSVTIRGGAATCFDPQRKLVHLKTESVARILDVSATVSACL